MKCRLCNGSAKQFLDLGKVPLPEEFRTKKELHKPISKYPLGLSYCKKCGHVQLTSKVNPERIYKENYFYDYSITSTGEKHWSNMARTLSKQFNLKKKDLVVDIGSNTGKLLLEFEKLGLRIYGVDPSTKHVRIARKKGVPTLDAFFDKKSATTIVHSNGKAKIITCNNTYDHVDSLFDFMKGVTALLDPSGVFIIEVPYFKNMVETLSHIPYHQQIDYMMLTPFIPFVKKFDMEVFDAEEVYIHGGSIRIYIGQREKTNRLKKMLIEERILMKKWPTRLGLFAKSLLKQRDDLKKFIVEQKKSGKKIAGVGASAKGINLLNYAGIGSEYVDFITEKSSLKQRLFTPTGIPIHKDDILLKRSPDFAILLAWNFKAEVTTNLSQYIKNGGIFIIPIPRLAQVK